MSIFASIAIVCTMATCSDYVVDHASTMQDALTNTQVIQDKFLVEWNGEETLTKWLNKYKIGETVFEIVSIEFETKEIKEDMIP